MRNKPIFYLLPAALSITLLSALPSCKPTEKNYREAYEVAQKKRQQSKEDSDFDVSQLIGMNDARTQSFGGIECPVISENLKTVDAGDAGHLYNVAVAAYKMTANALSHAESLRKEGMKGYVMQNSRQLFFVMCGGADTPEEAAAVYTKYMASGKQKIHPGLANGPEIVRNPAYQPANR